MADRYLLESGAPDGYLLEDASGVLLLETTRLWLPSDLATAPKVWLDANALTGADGSTVSTFTDQEGNFNATLVSGTGPALRYAAQNALKVVEFTSTAAAQMTFSSLLMNGAAQGCFFALFKLKNDPTLNNVNGGDVAAILDAFTSDVATNLGSHHPYTDGVFYDHFGVAVRQTLGNPTPSFSSSYRLFNCEITSGGTYTSRIDATQFYQAAAQTVDFGAKTRNLAHTLGGGPNDFYLNGYIAEVLILDYIPSSTEQAQIEGYLEWRWGEQANLPGGHAYASAAPTVDTSGTNVALTGQSLTGAVGSILAAAALALSGGSLSTSQGSVQQGAPITGQSAAVAQGSVSNTVSIALTGQPLSVTQGTVQASVPTSAALTGQSGSIAQGTAAPGISVSLTGQALTAVRGTAAPATASAVTGQTAAIGQASVVSAPSFALSGQAFNVARGSVVATPIFGLSGQGVAAARGSVLASSSIALTGNTLTVARGTVSATAPGIAALTGQSIVTARGTASPGTTIGLTGQSLGTAQSILAPATGLGISGQQTTTAQGAFIFAASPTLVGQEMTAHQATLLSETEPEAKFWNPPPLTGRRRSVGRSR